MTSRVGDSTISAKHRKSANEKPEKPYKTFAEFLPQDGYHVDGLRKPLSLDSLNTMPAADTRTL
jgi:hypothetical protein